ncbi:ABC-type branched-chain amino acid transporter (periplasmic) [Rubidibacter lacunae KORDI 51-2]|uniref:ABC-type branched-chain amino acid transporter (Periplasmic) n=1 Tax=Rubidibacter lacunae KORDI 51-2 TaxID=582515 RepID=U5D621_9CHRO|nr:ABC transporter substrate-binding protein [Rubidibacter lacunae]ERN40083.1 ABC-type branched-chain amino acid transporter (periplasmic) [Rubidibacter lacunae KORDI 51-2]
MTRFFLSSKPPAAFSAAAIALSAGLLAAACQTNTPTDSEPEAGSTETPEANASADEGGDSSDSEPLKLGSLLPTTGDLASIGQNMPIAVDLAVKTINACGGVNGQEVILIQEDSQTDPNAGAAAMSKLVEVDKVAGVVGAFASSVSSAAVDTAVRNEVLFISPGSTSPVFSQRAEAGEFNGYWARTAPPDTYQAAALAKLASERGFETAATVAINNDYGVGFEQVFVESFQEAGGEVVNSDSPVRYDPKATTFDTEAAAAFGEAPEAVLGVLYAETGSLLLKSAFEQGLTKDITVLLTDGVYSPDFVKSVGKGAGGSSVLGGDIEVLGTVPGADGQALESLTTLWAEDTGKELTAFVPHSWDAAILLMLAAQAAGENTGPGIQANLQAVANEPGQEVSDVCEAMELLRNGEEINYQGASGDIELDDNGDTVGAYDVWTVSEDGSLETIGTVNPGS